MKISFVLDRWEEEFGVCCTDTDHIFLLLRTSFPTQTKEQDWCLLQEDGSICVDSEKTNQMRNQNKELFRSLLRGK